MELAARPDSEIETETSGRTDTAGVTKRRVALLIAQRRQNLPRDEHVTEYTHTDQNGDKIYRVEYNKKDGSTKTVDANLSRLLSAAPSTTSNLEVLRVEAEQAANGRTDMNPHLPSNDDVLDTATETIKDAGLTPAWEVIDGD